MNYIKNNIVNLILFIAIIGYLVYLEFKPETITVNPIVNIINKDSIESVIKEQYRLKLDSVSKIYNTKIYKLNIENKNLRNEIKNLESVTGELPDFK